MPSPIIVVYIVASFSALACTVHGEGKGHARPARAAEGVGRRFDQFARKPLRCGPTLLWFFYVLSGVALAVDSSKWEPTQEVNLTAWDSTSDTVVVPGWSGVTSKVASTSSDPPAPIQSNASGPPRAGQAKRKQCLDAQYQPADRYAVEACEPLVSVENRGSTEFAAIRIPGNEGVASSRSSFSQAQLSKQSHCCSKGAIARSPLSEAKLSQQALCCKSHQQRSPHPEHVAMRKMNRGRQNS